MKQKHTTIYNWWPKQTLKPFFASKNVKVWQDFADYVMFPNFPFLNLFSAHDTPWELVICHFKTVSLKILNWWNSGVPLKISHITLGVRLPKVGNQYSKDFKYVLKCRFLAHIFHSRSLFRWNFELNLKWKKKENSWNLMSFL